MPIEVQSVAAPASTPAPAASRIKRFSLGRKRVRAKDRMFFTERLALLLETGTPLHASLDALAKQMDGNAMQTLIQDLRESVSAGRSFSQALAEHPDAFPRSYVNLIGAAEVGGFMPQALERLMALDESREELRATLVSAITYPAFLIFASVAVVAFVLTVVFPRFEEIFSQIGDQLPLSTVVLMSLSNLLRHQWLPLGVATLTIIFVVWRWLRTPQGAVLFDRFLLRIPGIRDIVIQLYLVQFMRVMSLSLGNGVGMVDALRSCMEVVGSATFQGFIERLRVRVSEGQGFTRGFEQTGFMPPLVKQMVATGEESGNLALVMGRVADLYEREWKKKLELLAKVAEPMMLLVVGALVGLIVASLILPIFKLSKVVR